MHRERRAGLRRRSNARECLQGIGIGLRKCVLLSLALGTLSRGAELRIAPDTIEARAQGCATCHGAHGEGTRDPSFPRIAGKPAGYLFNQLQNFRDGQRSYPPMNYLLAYMHDDYLRELADYFAAPPAEPARSAPPIPAGEVQPAAVTAAAATTTAAAATTATAAAATAAAATAAAAGEHLVRHGDAATAVPACVLCHGSQLTGMQPGIPGLAGLNGRYIAGQLVAWRVGTRQAKKPDCMREIATRLTEAEVREVAAWLAAAPAPTPATPAAAGSWTMPIPCGSEP